MSEGIVLLIDLGVIIVFVLVAIGICKLWEAIFDYRIKKVKCKYPELIADMEARIIELDKWCKYWNTEVAPVMREIDNLVKDNYTQTDLKERQLYDLRAKLSELKKPYEVWEKKDKLWREHIQKAVQEIYKTDRRIKFLWTIREDKDYD